MLGEGVKPGIELDFPSHPVGTSDQPATNPIPPASYGRAMTEPPLTPRGRWDALGTRIRSE